MHAVIDLGSNKIRLVIYNIVGKNMQKIYSEKKKVGLGAQVDTDGNLNQQAIKDTLLALLELKETLQKQNIHNISVFATASLRNIKNSTEVVEFLNKNTGFNIDVLSGQQEALYDLDGALLTSETTDGVMFDIGGGSTEIVVFKNRKATAFCSLPIGSLNMYAKHIIDDNYDEDVILKIKNDIILHIEKENIVTRVDKICAVGGTTRTVMKILKHRGVIQRKTYAIKHLHNLYKIKTTEDFKRTVEIVAPDRKNTIITGIIILNILAEMFDAQVVETCKFGVREGYLKEILK